MHVGSFKLISDVSLTVDSVTKVMEMVPADKVMKVWGWLGVPESLVEKISRKFSTTKEKTRGCVDLYLNCYPNDELSWWDITGALYTCGEMAAAREAKSFYHQYGEQRFCVEVEEVGFYPLFNILF